jgi:acyl-CoA synthetase (AMP-forming)/AMP-acid ligase II
MTRGVSWLYRGVPTFQNNVHVHQYLRGAVYNRNHARYNHTDMTAPCIKQKNTANHVPLTPLSFLKRAALVNPDQAAWINQERQVAYCGFYQRCKRLASALVQRGISKGDVVSVVCPNTPSLLEVHYGVAMTGGVLNAVNIGLDTATISYILQHSQAKVIIYDYEHEGQVNDALSLVQKGTALPLLVRSDGYVRSTPTTKLCHEDYEDAYRKKKINHLLGKGQMTVCPKREVKK